jgi:hypothetical protein
VTAPRALHEVIVEAYPEAERNLPRGQRTVRRFRVSVAGPLWRIPVLAEDAMTARFMTLLRITGQRQLRKATRREPQGVVTVEDIV